MEIRPEVPKESLQFHMTPEQASVYTAFAESDQDGITLHHSELTSELAELGFVAGLPDVGHLALQVLPGSYSVEGKAWRLHTDHGKVPVDNPLYPTLKAALQVKNMIWETLKHRVFVRGVVVLPDMSPDSDLPAQVDDDLVWIVCGSENLVERLMELARNDQDLTRSPADVMREDMAALTRAPGPAGPGPNPAAPGQTDRHGSGRRPGDHLCANRQRLQRPAGDAARVITAGTPGQGQLPWRPHPPSPVA